MGDKDPHDGFRNRAYTDDEDLDVGQPPGNIPDVPDIIIHANPDDEGHVTFKPEKSNGHAPQNGHAQNGGGNGFLHPEHHKEKESSSSNNNNNNDEDDNEEAEEGGDSNEAEKAGGRGRRKKFDNSVTLRQLFQFSDKLDALYMVFGSLGAILHGLSLPGQLIIFGQLVNNFIDFTQQRELIRKNATAVAPEDVIDIESEMLFYAQIYAYVAVASWIVGYMQCAFWSISAIRQIQRIRMLFFNSILRQNVGWFDVNEAGGLTTRMFEDLQQIQSGIGDKVGNTLQAVSTLVGGFGVAFVFGWKLALVMLAVCPLIVMAGALTGKVMASLTSKEQTAYAQAGAIAEQAISSIRTVVAFGGEKEELDSYNAKLVLAEEAGIKKAVTGAFSMGVFFIVMAGAEALAFWYGSTLVADEDFPPGSLLTVFFSILIGSAQIGQAGPNMEALATAKGAAYYVYQVIKRKSPIDTMNEEGKKPDFYSADQIQFQNIHFHYPSRTDIPVLQGFDLTVNKGQTVALVGESGCGKSTTIKLLQRFYDVIGGSVMIGKDNIKDINVKWLRQHIGIVSQEPVLFDMTIADNIRMGKDNATQQEIEQAAINANAHDFITNLPKAYDTNVGEGGAQLSGGQKQRIAIARALIKDPQILLLDEATSALDTESESIVQTALDNASMGRTTIIIAHRLSTVKNADLIVAVQDGRVAEKGTHDELMARKGVYYQLVMLQTLAEQEEHELSETGSLITEEEREALLQVRMMRSLSQMSGEQGASIEDISFARALSVRKSKSDRKKRTKKAKKKSKKEALIEEAVDPAPISRVLSYNKPEWHLMGMGLIFSAMHGCIPIFFAFIIGQVLGALALPDKEQIKEESKKWSLVFLAMGAANCIGYGMGNYLFGKSGERLTRRLRSKAFECILKQDIAYFDDPYHGTGQLTARLATDASKVKGATSSRISVLVQVSFTALSALFVAFYYSWKLTLLVIAFVPFLVFGGVMRASRFKNFAAKEGKRLLEASAVSQQALMNIRTVASLGKEDYFYERFSCLLQEPYPKSKTQAHWYGVTFGSARGLSFFANSAAFALGGYLVQNDELGFQDVFKIIIAATFGSMIAGQALSFTPDYLSAKVAAGRLFKLFDTESKIDVNQPGGKIKECLDGDVDFLDVQFNYPTRPDVPVLQGLSLQIRTGQKVALVGASGCGKSTAVGLLERFYNPKKGDITIDGMDISDYNLKWLRSQISIVSQEPVLFAKSIKDNITYGLTMDDGKPIPQKLIEESARNANIHDFIMTLPLGYETLVGEKGTLISGGQKQRIAIARALIRDPRILLLDEATSALDSESEKVVQDALDRAMEGRTSIIIAHRLSTIQNADIIAVIQGGRVIEWGTHSELLTMRGAYYVLNSAQM
ncbi:ATP-dependent translocase ABCB1-like isoform X2 [Clytia hemisphaerica]|uniref:ABC-type xenobiotic transporter n=1 Tax=Clytia hemisphaerica TaxID=252671 RepID=A0A7M5UPF8_9CNID